MVRSSDEYNSKREKERGKVSWHHEIQVFRVYIRSNCLQTTYYSPDRCIQLNMYYQSSVLSLEIVAFFFQTWTTSGPEVDECHNSKRQRRLEEEIYVSVIFCRNNFSLAYSYRTTLWIVYSSLWNRIIEINSRAERKKNLRDICYK